ncbi:hypothetical protein DTO164E3_8591 [Paecilomyces variotii]|nr:hypothetical protein DTO164E3_8591 [Paecilomyces variotii]KAJ9259473.1 hypothetical protein DTO207G8_1036 [Paecilomyces variotii]KAJ9286897.1 hypothetical protein DTO021C3_5629 [Paecilomyces variotii]
MSSCFGRRKSPRGGDTEPLLPRYEDETVLQRRVHQKLHSYQMLRALAEGYMPSTEQTIANLRTLLASDVLNPNPDEVSPAGRQLTRDAKLGIRTFIELLRDKNSQDQLQDFLWHLSKSRAQLDTGRLTHQASRIKHQTDVKAAYDSIRTVGGLLMTNADFRLFVDDLATVGRQIFSDTAFSLADTAREVGKEVKPSQAELETVQGPGSDEAPPPSTEEIRAEATEIAKLTGNGVAQTGKTAVRSTEENLSGERRETLFYRLKQVVGNLRQRTDYADSVSTISKLVQQYAKLYSGAAENTVEALEEDVELNEDVREAVERFWTLVSSFGNKDDWKRLREQFNAILSHTQKDPEFEKLMSEIGSALQEMLTDPGFFDSAEEKVEELKEKSKSIGSDTGIRQDVDAFLQQAKRTLKSVADDEAVAKSIAATKKIYHDVSDAFNSKTSMLSSDLVHVFLPLLIRSVQRIPIPRLEISVPEMDLLVENLVLEPGRTVRNSSFLPFKSHLSTRNDIELVKTHSKRTTTNMKTNFTLSIFGLSMAASEFGYWLRAHSGPFLRLKDEGIASFYLDERGIDISVDVEVGRDHLEHIFTLRGVRVHIHKLNYNVRRSKWSFLLWLVKPFLKQLVRRVLEKKIAEQIVTAARALNRELVFARERLRATRIADPQDLATFIRAVTARLKPRADPDVYTRIGADAPDTGVFHGVYAPGSIVKLWHEEAERAHDAVEHGDASGGLGMTWRNDIFDVTGTPA